MSELQLALNSGLLPRGFSAHVDETAAGESHDEALKRRRMVIRHARDIARLEIVSPIDKSTRQAVRIFVGKAIQDLQRGCHLLLVDLFPPSLHGLIWRKFSDTPFILPPGELLTLVAYSAGVLKQAYLETTAVGRELMDMPLFLAPESYVIVPLAATYQRTYSKVPPGWQSVLEGPAS
jgi:hypothetical protein